MKNQFKKIIQRALKKIDLSTLFSFDKAPAAGEVMFTRSKPVMALRAPGPDLTPNLNAILLHLCDGDFDTAEWILRWLAFPLRNPGAKMATALWMRGGQGSGKDLIFSTLIKPMYGLQAGMVGQQFDSPFNSWALGRRYMVVNDFECTRSAMAVTKSLLTSREIVISRKAKPGLSVPNHMNFVFLSGRVDAIAPDNSDRRWMIVDVPPALPASVYAGASMELQAGASQAWLLYLMETLDMADFDAYTPANRGSKVQQ